jgi:hypothetical protein
MEDVKVEEVKMEDLELVASQASIETTTTLNGDERSATPTNGPVRSLPFPLSSIAFSLEVS